MLPASHPINLVIALAFLLIISGCGTDREVTVVDRDPNTAETDPAELDDDQEEILRIGELNPVLSMDPLYAVNTTSRRTVSQLYEGLVRFDENNEIRPAGARQWEVSDDSLTYTFKLNRDVFFHDSEVFHNGIGRRVNAQDYKFVFQRMASRDVPPDAAELFIDHIRGFESYYKEQREVYFPEDRFVDDIEGIHAQDDSTLVFELNEPSDHFLQKLASPHAVVYPREAVREGQEGLRGSPVGSGPFEMETMVGDSIFVMARNEDFVRRGSDNAVPNIDRLEILYIPDETRLFQQLTLENLDMIVDLGPQMISELVDTTNELSDVYTQDFQLKVNERSEPIKIEFNRNNRYGLSREHAISLIAPLSEEELISRTGIPSIKLTRHHDNEYEEYFAELTEQFPSDADDPDRLPVAFQRDTDVGVITGSLFDQLSDDLGLSFMPRRISSRDIFMYVNRPMLTTVDENLLVGDDEVLRLNYDRYLIANQETEGIELNDLAWWLDLTDVTVPDFDPEL